MKKQMFLWIDQYGNRIWARTQKELRERCGGGAVRPIYQDRKDGSVYRVGVSVGSRWFSKYAAVEQRVN